MTNLWFFNINKTRVFYGAAIFLLFGVILGSVWFDYMDEQELASIDDQKNRPIGQVSVVIHIDQRILEIYSDGQLHKKYRIAVGKSKTPTPIGEWNVVWKAYNWGTGFGTRWMGLNVPWGIYGIHGTNKPWSIGQFASHGCIRMRNRDVEELFEWIPVGTPVRIEGRKIRIKRALKYQMNGADVVILQIKLRELGYLDTRADGIFGLATDAAIKRFQAEHEMEEDGIVDMQMLELLGL
ncbi:L,D-transpeptidase family protein [Anaerosinus massiliensis]|uniref:L,D-transpeptidase family protein n=1 Tax=Massilibacillus massiliensis TaxID=1806837 RepID=UPI000A59A1F5|nr:L,D-transpeptidase family protein [Massilibacillus massiliensis]